MSMRILLILCFIVFSSYLFSQDVVVGERFEKEKIAIYPFADEVNRYADEGMKIRELVENTVVNMNRFVVVDRENLEVYLKEKELQLAGLTTEDIVEGGELIGYNKAIFGTITRFNTIYEAGSFIYDIPPSVSTSIQIVIKIVDVHTGKILYSSRVEGHSKISLQYRNRYSGARIAVDAAYEDLMGNVKSKLRNIFKITIKIADVQRNGKVVLLAGDDIGMRTGWHFKVYRQGDEIVLSDGNVLKGNLSPVGSIKIISVNENYSIGKISRGLSIQKGDLATETLKGGLFTSIYVNYASYKSDGSRKVFNSRDSAFNYGGKLNIELPKIDYSLGVHFKIGYNASIFTPNFSIGLLFGDYFQTTWGLDMRFNIDMNIPLFYDYIMLNITPYFGVVTTFSKIGYVSGGDYYGSSFDYIRDGSRIYSDNAMIGAGGTVGLTFNITDTFGISGAVGYRFYSPPLNISTYASHYYSFNNEVDIDIGDILDLTGIEYSLSFNFLL